MKFVSLLSSLAPLLAGGLVSAAAVDSSSVLLTRTNGGTPISAQQLSAQLAPVLSHQNIISFTAPARWSTFNSPDPAITVNVATEQDVAVVVKLCTTYGIPFLAQNGGNGWATTFNLGQRGVLINLAGLDSVTFNADKTRATIGGGSNINNTIAKAYAAGALIETGNCNCVGALGAILGGGYGNLMGLYGFGVDNVISVRLVTADGKIRDVSATSDPDLFWALRGAGPNLGIVTSAVVKSYPAKTSADLQAWTGALIFTPDKLEQVVQFAQDLVLQPDMNFFLYFISSGPPSNSPVVLTTPFLYKGNATTGQALFAGLYAIGPIVDTTSVLPYNQWNAGGDGFCVRDGDRKPSYGAGFQKMVPATWRAIWNKYVDFQQLPGAESTVVLLEAYSLIKARSAAVASTGGSFPHRDVNFNAVAIAWYNDTALDGPAQAFGSAARDLWRSTDDLAKNATYVNFAHGDESLDTIYGSSLPKLKSVKQRVDPKNQFNQWFDIK
ncbi:FAD binding domain-containing protein [Bombardia bombarda]|uniref:FAD binding domain-containing protein n=1 Tax=Bombardia bombarda TaxID=252184 RepID=A0AA39WU32_9PEZI|nr:FAD binding domain-containing protein [Bombardia bombarda]